MHYRAVLSSSWLSYFEISAPPGADRIKQVSALPARCGARSLEKYDSIFVSKTHVEIRISGESRNYSLEEDHDQQCFSFLYQN